MDRPNFAAGTGGTHEANLRGTKYQQEALVLQLMHPQPPGSFVVEPSFFVPGFPGLDDRHLPPFVAQNIFFDALQEGQ